MEHHFVVYYDDKSKQWEVDTSSTDARFGEGNVWDNTTQDWYDWNDDTEKALGKLHDIFLDANEGDK